MILFRPGLENNLVSNAMIKLNLTVAAYFISNLFDNYVCHEIKSKKKKREKNEEM